MARAFGLSLNPAGKALCLFAGLFLLCAGSAQARPEVSEVEMKMVPRYCPDTMGFGGYGDAYSNTSPRARHWVSLMGPSFWHMHHYCLALVFMNRSHRAALSSSQRKFLWQEALANYIYVTDRAETGFIMLPEIYTRIGDVELLLANHNKAEQAFARARQLKPDYWPAYTHWAEHLMRNGKRSEAMQVVRSGLEQAPGTKVLLEQYRLLGGKPSELPKPMDKPPPPADKAPAENAPAQATPADNTPAEEPPAGTPTEAAGGATPTSSDLSADVQ